MPQDTTPKIVGTPCSGLSTCRLLCSFVWEWSRWFTMELEDWTMGRSKRRYWNLRIYRSGELWIWVNLTFFFGIRFRPQELSTTWSLSILRPNSKANPSDFRRGRSSRWFRCIISLTFDWYQKSERASTISLTSVSTSSQPTWKKHLKHGFHFPGWFIRKRLVNQVYTW